MLVQNTDKCGFKALNISKVAPEHMKYINRHIGALNELGKMYDINIKSGWYSGYDMGYPTLEVSVSKLKSIFSKSKSTAFLSGPHALGFNGRNILDNVFSAISKYDDPNIIKNKINYSSSRNEYIDYDVTGNERNFLSYPSFGNYIVKPILTSLAFVGIMLLGINKCTNIKNKAQIENTVQSTEVKSDKSIQVNSVEK